jgi:PAS domain S-box-containing protein
METGVIRGSPGRFGIFLAVSALLIGAVVVFAGAAVGRFFEHHVLDREEAHTARIVQNQALQHLTADDFAAPLTDDARRRFQDLLEGLPGVFRLKVFDPAGRIVWSDEPRLIGRSFADNPYVAQARAGRVVTVLEPPRRAEHVYERGRGWVAEAYVPVTLPGAPGPAGVIETYTDMTATMAAIRSTQRTIWTVAGGLGTLLYLALALVVWNASESERRAIARLEAQNRELRLIQRFTNSVLAPLDLQTLAAGVVTSAGEGLGLARAALYRVGTGGSPEPLATWPASAPHPTPPGDLVAEALAARRPLVRGTTAVLPVPIRERADHLFVADFARPPAASAPPPGLRTLEIMLSEAAIALANVELFTAIREAHERLAAILAGVADRMLIVDRDMRVVWTNPAALAGCEAAADPVGMPCFEAFGVAPEACQGCPAVRAFESGRVERGVRVQRLRGGEARYLDLVAAPLRDASGAVHQVLEVARDITELVQMEERLKESAARLEESHREVLAKAEQLEQTNQALREAQARLVERERLAAAGEVVVGLHHAILNPLTGILGALQVLKQEATVAADTREAIAAAEAEIRRIEQIVRSLPSLRRAAGTPYVGSTTMLDLERAFGEEDPGG